MKRSYITKTFFNLLLTLNTDGNLDWRVSVINDLVLLCALQEGHFRKARSK